MTTKSTSTMTKQKIVKKVNVPNRAFREVTFDRTKIRSQIENLSYTEARRVRGPIYEALEEELYCEGCHMLPEFMACLGQKEKTLYESVSIRSRITDNRRLLYEMVDKLKAAELAVVKHSFKGFKECFTYFYETIKLLEPYELEYEYVLTAVLEKLISVCKNVAGGERDAAEMITRIYFKYGNYLEKKGDKGGAVEYLQMALNLVRGHVWLAEIGVISGPMLHEEIARNLAHVLLAYGHQVVRQQPEFAVELARKATLVVAEIGRERNLILFCKTFLSRALFLMENSRFMPARHVLDQIRTTILQRNDYSFVELNVQYYLYRGQIYENSEMIADAISNYLKALRLCCLYHFKLQEAETLLSLGKIYAKDKQRTSIAKECYENAKKIYIDHNDMHSKKQTVYLLAKLKADEITPLYMDMLKSTSSRYCAFYNLRQWKNCCRPFWTSLGTELLKQEADPIYCLLDEENSDQVHIRRSSTKDE